jgi:hypothetical protein
MFAAAAALSLGTATARADWYSHPKTITGDCVEGEYIAETPAGTDFDSLIRSLNLPIVDYIGLTSSSELDFFAFYTLAPLDEVLSWPTTYPNQFLGIVTNHVFTIIDPPNLNDETLTGLGHFTLDTSVPEPSSLLCLSAVALPLLLRRKR